MNRALILIVAATVLWAGCATSTPSVATDPRPVYVGEVWTWDEREDTVTLRQGMQTVRVKVTPDQMIGLRLHERVALRGEIAPPMPLAHIVGPTGPLAALPAGSIDRTELGGNVVSIDSGGLMTVDTPRGRMVFLTAAGGATRFAPGMPVRVHLSLQPVELVSLSDPRAQAAARDAEAPDPAALAGGRAGDWAVVTGRVISVNPGGSIVIESPSGPITVPTPDAARYRVGSMVRVRTFVQAGG